MTALLPTVQQLAFAAGWLGHPSETVSTAPGMYRTFVMLAGRAGLDFGATFEAEPPSAEDLAAAGRSLRERNNARAAPSPQIDLVAAWLEAGAPWR